MAFAAGLKSTYALNLFGFTLPGYAAIYALVLNFVVAIVLTFVFKALGMENGKDETVKEDYLTAS